MKEFLYVIKIDERHARRAGTELLSRHYFDHNFRRELRAMNFSCAL